MSELILALDVPRGGDALRLLRQAVIAAEAGLWGVVCSPQEVSLLRRRLGPEVYIVVPGIRRRSDPAQTRPGWPLQRTLSAMVRPISWSVGQCSKPPIRPRRSGNS